MVIPELQYTFRAGRIALHEAVTILPVFSDGDAADIARDLGMTNGAVLINKIRSTGAFKGMAGEILNYAPEGFILAGLGKKANFHPEAHGAAFRKLGALIARKPDLFYNIKISQAVHDAVLAFASLASGEAPPPALKKKKKKTTKAKTKTGAKSKTISTEGDDEDESDIPPDYLGRTDMAELLSQAVACMVIGSDSMDLLKKTRRKKAANPTDIGVEATGLNIPETRAACERGGLMGRMVNGARYTGNLPGNHFDPADCEKYVRALARQFKLKITVHNAKKLEEMGCGGIISVGKGSRVPPRMIIMEYKPAGKLAVADPVVLVGKGITFDTGGISIKPSAVMHEMKFDMGGAAAVMHCVALAAARKLPVHVVGLLGVAENMPDGNAVKPGDVYTAYDGTTVEVQNTDAEGRLVLGDVLAYAADKYKPAWMLDFATLTGACVVALGHHAAGVMSPSDELADRIDRASRKSLDRSWRLPHWFNYGAGLKSDVADLRNIAGRDGGSISAMRFLSNFVPAHIRWAHVDIAGTAWRGKDSGTQSKNGTGWGVRMVHQFLEDLTEK